MINIDATTVAVETSAELKSILEGNNSIALVYFAQDITLTVPALLTRETPRQPIFLGKKIKEEITFCNFFFFVLWLFYAVFISSLNLSAIIAINSLFVGLPLLADTVYPNILSTIAGSPLPHATSMA